MEGKFNYWYSLDLLKVKTYITHKWCTFSRWLFNIANIPGQVSWLTAEN
jgi:hypothetical protein